MNATSPQATSLFREPEGAWPNTLVLLGVSVGWAVSFVLMGADAVWLNIAGVLLCVQAMVLAAYLIHEAAHYTLFATPAANRRVGEWVSFIAGAGYASFERIRHMHIRHHRDRADVTCFDFKGLLLRRPWLKHVLRALEWCYVPATEILMHGQVIARPFFVASQRQHLPRVVGMLVLRVALLGALGAWSLKALLLYGVAYGVLLHVLNFFDAFHHTFEQYFVEASQSVPMEGRDRTYEQANTYSNVISARWPVLNWLTLNFGYHNAHHERAAVPWYRLPALHRELFADTLTHLMPLPELLRAWHRHRVRRVDADHYGAPAAGERRADSFVGAHGVSFLTVV
jgi:fatty acid desaturase